MPRQQTMLPPKPRAVRRDRLNKPKKTRHEIGNVNPERIFLARWIGMNRKPWNYGQPLLELLLKYAGVDPPYTQRDHDIASTLMQWLGTNVGGGYLHECQRELELAREKANAQADEFFQEARVLRETAIEVSLDIRRQFRRGAPRRFEA